MKSLYESIFDTEFEPTVDNTVAKPRSKHELQQIIDEHIKQIKPRPGQEVDLNWIDISLVDDLSGLFEGTTYIPIIDAWKIDHVKNFGYMFSGNEYIKSSPLPRLQENLKGKWCYHSMFEECTSLQVAPELPAKKLTYYCYWNMFKNCVSLQVAPELPAMELVGMCYVGMFEGCTSLQVAPELPAKKLKMGCYEEMFKNCNNLKTKAKIPTGTNLDTFAVQDMYKGCHVKANKKL